MSFCKLQGHDSNNAKYICLCQECTKNRFICDLCINSNIHQHQYEYFISLSSFKDICYSLFDQKAIQLTDEFINHVIKKQIIAIDSENHSKFYCKLSMHKKQSADLQGIFSINQQLMATWAKDESLKIWHNYKLIKQMKIFIDQGVFSQDDAYLYIGQKDKIIVLDVNQNFKQSGVIQLETNKVNDPGFEFAQINFIKRPKCITNIKLISNKIVLVSVESQIFRVDFNLKQLTLKINQKDRIRSLDYQKSKNVILCYTNIISLWDSNGKLILKNKGCFLQKITQINFSSFIPLMANFIGDDDKIITVNPNEAIIWVIDYNKKLLYLDKIILSISIIKVLQLNLEKRCVNLLREQDFISFSLIDYQYKMRNHRYKLLQPLTQVNNFKEMVFQNYSNQLALDQLMVVGSSFYRL